MFSHNPLKNRYLALEQHFENTTKVDDKGRENRDALLTSSKQLQTQLDQRLESVNTELKNIQDTNKKKPLEARLQALQEAQQELKTLIQDLQNKSFSYLGGLADQLFFNGRLSSIQEKVDKTLREIKTLVADTNVQVQKLIDPGSDVVNVAAKTPVEAATPTDIQKQIDGFIKGRETFDPKTAGELKSFGGEALPLLQNLKQNLEDQLKGKPRPLTVEQTKLEDMAKKIQASLDAVTALLAPFKASPDTTPLIMAGPQAKELMKSLITLLGEAKTLTAQAPAAAVEVPKAKDILSQLPDILSKPGTTKTSKALPDNLAQLVKTAKANTKKLQPMEYVGDFKTTSVNGGFDVESVFPLQYIIPEKTKDNQITIKMPDSGEKVYQRSYPIGVQSTDFEISLEAYQQLKDAIDKGDSVLVNSVKAKISEQLGKGTKPQIEFALRTLNNKKYLIVRKFPGTQAK